VKSGQSPAFAYISTFHSLSRPNQRHGPTLV
jgi:hypothetical protein